MTLTPAQINTLVTQAVSAIRETSSYKCQAIAVENAIRQALATQFESLVTIIPSNAAAIHSGLLNLRK